MVYGSVIHFSILMFYVQVHLSLHCLITLPHVLPFSRPRVRCQRSGFYCSKELNFSYFVQWHKFKFYILHKLSIIYKSWETDFHERYQKKLKLFSWHIIDLFIKFLECLSVVIWIIILKKCLDILKYCWKIKFTRRISGTIHRQV